jgi:(4-O-methyl)-D-glucuronate---lignin esterase
VNQEINLMARSLLFGSVLFALIAHSATGFSQSTGTSLPQPAHLTSERDHQRLMDLLRIPSLRRGADGDAKSPNAANYDESKANPYPNLPDPLVLKNGKKVTTAKVWWDQRRPEIAEDFDREIYGRVPENTPKVDWEVVSTTKEMNGEIPVITKKLIGHVDNSAYPLVSVNIDLTLTTPAKASDPVPVMMEFSLSPEVLAALTKRYPQMFAPTSGPSWQQQVLAKGWGYAVYIPTSVQADKGDGLTQGVIGLVNKGQSRKPDDWGALRAWAWGASRALDYFETDRSVDAKQVGVEGHSRYGKAALVAMAYDSRFAIAYISSSGEGGAKLFRRSFGEQIGNVAGTGEYHWMAGNFLKYAGPLTENDLPVDAHELIALCAPRPVFIGAGATQGDGWVDAKGMFLAAVSAGPVYKLLGKKDLGTSQFPPIETALIDGDIAFRQHTAGHTPAPNWPTFLTFAGRYLKEPVPPSPTHEHASTQESKAKNNDGTELLLICRLDLPNERIDLLWC